jgi:DNA-binding MarR family transcriptional regulator
VNKVEPNDFVERLRALLRCLRAATATTRASLDLGLTQARFLRYIGRNSGISQADLARATESDPTLTGRILETLIERDLVRRNRSAEDRRQYVLELTLAGQRLRRKVEQSHQRIAAQIQQVLDPRDREDFDRIAGKLLWAFAGLEPEPGGNPEQP